MAETWLRLAALGLAVTAVAGAGWWRAASRHRLAPIQGLPAGAVLFGSTACGECPPARRVLEEVMGDDWHELDANTDRELFAAAGIQAVPVVVITAASGRQRRFAGVPSKRWLKRAAAILEQRGPSS